MSSERRTVVVLSNIWKNYYILIIVCFITLGCYVASYMRIPIVPIYAKNLGASTKMVGMINSAFFFTAGALSFPMGFLSDRFGRKIIACVGLIILSFTCFALYFTTSPLQILVIYFLFGVGLSTYGPTMMSFVADITPSSHIGRAYGWYTTSLYLGMSIGPALGSWTAEKLDYGSVFLISGGLTLLLFVIMFFALPKRKTTKTPTNPPHQPGKSLKVIQTINSALVACWIITFGGCFALGMFVTFIPLHAHDAGIALSHIGLIFFTQGLTNALSRAPFGWLSDKVTNRNKLVMVGIFAVMIAILGFAFSKSLTNFVLNAFFLGGGMALAFPSIGAIITEVTSSETRGIAMGGYNTAIYFGIMSASLTMGPIIEKWGYRLAFEIAACLTLLLTATFLVMMKRYYLLKKFHQELSIP
ncbi:MAG: MFS transporter [Thermodesulforhabdaceae bacterium]